MGSTVIYYQHKARREDPFYADQLKGLLASHPFPGASCLALEHERVSQRYHMFIIRPKHAKVGERWYGCPCIDRGAEGILANGPEEAAGKLKKFGETIPQKRGRKGS